MSDLTAYARIRAYFARQAVPLSGSRHFPISRRPLLLVPLQMAGEAPALLAIGIGDLQGNLQVLSCPNPPNRDHQYAMLEAFSMEVAPWLSVWACENGDMPQIICQSERAGTLLQAIFDKMHYCDPSYHHSALLQETGRRLFFFNKRFERLESAALLAATTAFTQLFATGQDPSADMHLGALLEWIKPDDGKIFERVIKAEERPASVSTDPDFDRETLAPLIKSYYRAERSFDMHTADKARNALHTQLYTEVRYRYDLILQALRAVQSIPEAPCARAIASGDAASYRELSTYIDSGGRLPRRFKGNRSTLEYLHRDQKNEEHEMARLDMPGRHRAEARLTGEVLSGTIVARRTYKTGRTQIVEIDLQTSQGRTPIHEGNELRLLDSTTEFRFRVDAVTCGVGGLTLALTMKAGMRSVSEWPDVGDHAELALYRRTYSAKVKIAAERLRNASPASIATRLPLPSRNYLLVLKKNGEATMNNKAADVVANQVFNAMVQGHSNIVVPSPPGAGKTYLLEGCQALAGLHLRKNSLVVAHTNTQADDIVIRTARRFPRLRMQRLISHAYEVPPELTNLPNVIVSDRAQTGIHSIVATSAKLNEIGSPPTAAFLMIDEAWQLRYSDYLMLQGLAGQHLMIGDFGQIRALNKIPVRNWADDPLGPHLPAPKVLLDANQALRFQLPLSRRLPTDSAELICAAFYPGMPFTGLSTPAMRQLVFRSSCKTHIDRLLDQAAAAGSMVAITLPPSLTFVTDAGLIGLLVDLVNRLLARRTVVLDDGKEYPLNARHVGVVASRREQVASIRQALGALANDILVDTANRYQGLERPVMFALHPLSGMMRPSAFELDPGRMCVSISRHRVLCLVLSRDDIDNSLVNYIPEDDRYLGQLDDLTYDGMRAHSQIWDHLRQSNRILRA